MIVSVQWTTVETMYETGQPKKKIGQDRIRNSTSEHWSNALPVEDLG